jgi:hypothetical protein
MSTELLPCPFCGGEAEIERYGDSRSTTKYCCTACCAFLETGEEWDHGADWNKRANLDTELLASMKAERDEADRRAGAAERELADLKDRQMKADMWMEEAKAAAGYHRNDTFDDVWAEALAALKEKQAKEGS